MFDKFKELLEAQKQLGEIKKGLEGIVVEQQTLSGKVKVLMSGIQKIVSVSIDDELLTPQKRDVLERAVVDCVNGAADKVQKEAAQKMKTRMGNLNIPGF